MVIIRYIVLYLSIVFLTVTYVAAQEDVPILEHHFHEFNSMLPSNSVYKLSCDSKGYIWIASNKGLIRTRGLLYNKDNIAKIDNNSIVNVYTDRKNHVWYASYQRNYLGFDLTSEKSIDLPQEYGFKLNSIDHEKFWNYALETDSTISFTRVNLNYTLHFKHKTTAFTKYNYNTPYLLTYEFLKKHWAHPQLLKDIGHLQSFYEHNQYYPLELRFYSNALIYRNKIYIKEQGAIHLIFDAEEYKLNDDVVTGFKIVNHSLFVGFLNKHGLIKIDSSSPKKYISIDEHLKVTDIQSDLNHNLWVSTYNSGIYLYSLHKYYSAFKKIFNSENNAIKGFEKYQNYYIISFENQNIEIKSEIKSYNVSIPFTFKNITDNIKSIIPIKKNTLLIFGAKELFVYDTQKKTATMIEGLKKYNFKDILVLGKTVYFAQINNIYAIDSNITVYKPISYTQDKIFSIQPIDKKQIYIANFDSLKLNDKLYTNSPKNISKLYKIKNQLLVINNDGLFKKNIHKDSLQFAKVSDEKIETITSYKDSILISLGDNKLNIFDAQLGLINKIDLNNYGIDQKANQLKIYNDKIYIATNKSIFQAEIAQLLYLKNIIPPVFVHSIFNNNIQVGNNTQFKYHRNSSYLLRLEILNYTNSSYQVSYKHLKDDNEWKPIENNKLTLYNPQPGSYNLIVKIDGGELIKPIFRNVSINILPLWYQTWWFKAMLFLCIIALITFFIYRIYDAREQLLRKIFNLQKESNENKLSAMVLSLKPHFVFNMLSPLQGFIIDGNTKEALMYLSYVSDLLRKLFKLTLNPIDSIENNIKFIEDYLHIQQKRFSFFTYTIEKKIYSNPKDILIPGLILQPIIENAIEHGLRHKKEDAQLHIIIEEDEKSIYIQVNDNGVGISSDNIIKENHALYAVEKQIKLLNDNKHTGTLEFAKNEPQGTKVKIKIPKKYYNETNNSPYR